MPEGKGWGWKVLGILGPLAAGISVYAFFFDGTPKYPDFTYVGEATVVYAESRLMTQNEEDNLNWFLAFLNGHENEYVRLDITLRDSPVFEDDDDPLQGLGIFPERHLTFYLGETLACEGDCPEEPRPENLLFKTGPSTHSVVIGDVFIWEGAAIGIEKNKWYKDNIARNGEHPRLRGCFLNIGRMDPPFKLESQAELASPSVTVTKTHFLSFRLRPASGKCE